MNARSAPGSPAGLREANRARVLDAVRVAGDPTQAAIALATGLAPATVSNIVRDLSAAGRVEVADAVRSGRRARVVHLTSPPGAVAGVDVGHGHVRVAVADLAHRILADGWSALPGGHSAEHGLGVAAELLADVLDRAGVGHAALHGAGIGLSAPVDAASGTVLAPGILPGWVGVDAPTRAAERLGLPVWVDNDATLGTLAEWRWGALRGVEEAVYLKLSDGVGAGLILGGRLHRGPWGTAGEIGHVVVVESDGAVCRCGNRGCLETVASTATVVGLLEPLLGRPLTIREIVARAREGSAPARRVLADTGHRVGAALGAIASVLTPTHVVVGGELALADDLVLGPLGTALERGSLPGVSAAVTVTTATTGERAHVLGAVALALERVEQGATPPVPAGT